MPAISDEQVFDFEGNLERAVFEFLADNGLDLANGNNPQRLSDDYIAIQVTINGLAEDEHMSEKPDNNLEYDHYLFTIKMIVHTDRDENRLPNAAFSRYHRELCAKVRSLLSISRAYSVASLNDKIDFYLINRLVPGVSDYTVFDSSADETTLEFQGDFSILTNAWPVT